MNNIVTKKWLRLFLGLVLPFMFAAQLTAQKYSGEFWEVTIAKEINIEEKTIPSETAILNFASNMAQIVIAGDTVICDGESTTLTASGSANYLWSTGETTASITVSPTATTTYSVSDPTGTNTSASVMVVVNVNPVFNLTQTHDSVCVGMTTIVIEEMVTPFDPNPNWFAFQSKNGGTFLPFPTAGQAINSITYGINTPSDTRQIAAYHVSPTTGCVSNYDTITLFWQDPYNHQILATGPTTLCVGQSVTLNITTDQVCTDCIVEWQESLDQNNWSAVSPQPNNSYAVPTGAPHEGTTRYYRLELLYHNSFCTENQYSDIVSVTVEASPILTISGDTAICEGESTTLTAAGGSSYLWSTGETTTSISVTPSSAGTQTFSVSDPTNNCSTAASATVTTGAPLIPIINPSGPIEICPGGQTTLMLQDISPDYSYQWQVSYNNGSTYSDLGGQQNHTIIATVFADGNYYYRLNVVDNISGCTGTSNEVLILVYPDEAMTVTGDLDICLGETTTLTASPATSYLWSTGETTQSINFTPTATGTSTLTITDPNNFCAPQGSVSIVTDAVNPITISGDTEICMGESTTLTASGAGNYLWSTGETTASITVTPTNFMTTYSVSNPGGCATGSSVTVTSGFVADLFINPDSEEAICTGELYTLTATNSYGAGSVQYQWQESPDDINWNDIGGETNNTYDINTTIASFNYYRVAGILNGQTCESYSVSVPITVVQAPILQITGDTEICAGESTTLTVSGGVDYEWSTNETTPSITVSPTASGTTYTVQEVDTDCANISASVTINVTQINIIVTPPIDMTICENDLYTLTANNTNGATIDFQWQESIDGNNWSDMLGQTASQLTVPSNVPGINNYRLFSTEIPSLCTDISNEIQITTEAAPVLQISGDTTMCVGETITLTASEGNQYLWSTGETTTSINVSPGFTTIYTVSDPSTGCEISASLELEVGALPTPVLQNPGPLDLCLNESFVAIVQPPPAPPGGAMSPPLNYQWETSPDGVNNWIDVPGATGSTYTIPTNQTGTFYYRVRSFELPDYFGCIKYSAVLVVNVAENTQIVISGDPGICPGGNTTTLTASGGSSYLWSTGETTASISVSSTGTYTVEDPTDDCALPASLVVFSHPTVIANINAPANQIVCQNEVVVFTTLSPGSSTYSYQWVTVDVKN